MKYHLAQLNIALAIAPLDTPIMEGFTSKLDEINALAESSTGFIWRLKEESGDATAIQAFTDPLMIVNMSVWESLEALKEYVFHSDHVAIMRQRKKWFKPLKEASIVFWWIPVGHKPTVEEAKERLELLRTQGANEKAFNFKMIFPPPQ